MVITFDWTGPKVYLPNMQSEPNAQIPVFDEHIWASQIWSFIFAPLQLQCKLPNVRGSWLNLILVNHTFGQCPMGRVFQYPVGYWQKYRVAGLGRSIRYGYFRVSFLVSSISGYSWVFMGIYDIISFFGGSEPNIKVSFYKNLRVSLSSCLPLPKTVLVLYLKYHFVSGNARNIG